MALEPDRMAILGTLALWKRENEAKKGLVILRTGQLKSACLVLGKREFWISLGHGRFSPEPMIYWPSESRRASQITIFSWQRSMPRTQSSVSADFFLERPGAFTHWIPGLTPC
jgi:hypothetical protein